MSPSHDHQSAPVGRKLRILVVDDEPTLRLGFAYALTSKTSEVETASTGRIALEMLAAEDFDIIILDLRMPELDGVGVMEALKNRSNRVPIILCSAALSASAAIRAIRMGVVDFLLKPVRPSDLRQAVDFVLYPERRPFPQAMKEVRSGRIDDAIRLIELQTEPGKKESSWLTILKAVRDLDENADISKLEEIVRVMLPILSINSTGNP